MRRAFFPNAVWSAAARSATAPTRALDAAQRVSERGAKMSMGYDHVYRSTFRGRLAALRGDVDGRGFGVDKLRGSALKLLKQLVRVNLCATPREGSECDFCR